MQALLGGGADEDRIATGHFLVGSLFLLLGGLIQLAALFSLRFDDLFPVSYGRLEAMSNVSLMLGFALLSLLGGVYYVLPRLTGTRLAGTGLARLTLFALAVLVSGGLLVIALGLGNGRQPLGLPWWMHIPIAVTLFLPALVALRTIANRVETRSFVTIWFVLAGLVWLPLLYLAYSAGDLPFLGSLAVTYSDLFFSAGFLTMVVIVIGSGLTYYTVVKELDQPLASRQLALVGLWSLGFAGVWWGIGQVVYGPGPGWVAGVAAALGLAFPIGALANAANVSLTLEGRWGEIGDRPGVMSGVLGMYLAVAVAVMASFASFPAVASTTALTAYWEAVEYAALLGVGTLLIAGISFEALPRAAGRRLPSHARARTFNRFTVVGVGGVLITLAAAGIISGYSWVAGSNTASYIDAGEGWALGAGAAEALTLIAVGFGVVVFLGQLAYVSVIVGTIFSGEAVTQEVLVDAEVSDE